MNTAAYPQATRSDNCRMVHLQGNDRAAARTRAADDTGAIVAPPEMGCPALPSWIEQRYRLPTHRVSETHALAFVEIAASAGIGQIVHIRRSTQRFGSAMIDVKRPARDKFRAVAVLAAMAGPLGDLTAQLLGNVGHGSLAQQTSEFFGQGVALLQQVDGLGLAQREVIFLLHQAHSLVVFGLGQLPLFL